MKLLISACLLGLSCRYDGGKKPLAGKYLSELMDKFELVPVCPEMLGGLPTPRAPSEKRDGGVFMRSGEDVTDNYLRGARQSLYLAELFGCRCALLKQRSPSCGSGQIYDGSFTGTVISGSGVTAELLMDKGIKVYSEENIQELLAMV